MNKTLKAIYEALHQLEAHSKERLYIHSNPAHFMFLLSATSGLIITQAPDPETLLYRMNAILRTYEE
jgi:hypothetical protein